MVLEKVNLHPFLSSKKGQLPTKGRISGSIVWEKIDLSSIVFDKQGILQGWMEWTMVP